MPLFHFHLDGHFSSRDDDDATELANLTDAISFAEELAAKLRRNHGPEELIGRNILIFDNAGNEVKQVPVIPAQ
jgi:hypothetical protein